MKSKNRLILYSVVMAMVVGMAKPTYSQPLVRESSVHPYHVDPWVTGAMVIVAIPGALIGVPPIWDKSPLTTAELQTLDKNAINPIDRWALKLDPSRFKYNASLSNSVLAGIHALPVVTMLDSNIREDWLDVLLMYSEVVAITNMIYLYSPFGPAFQNRLRPVVYYDVLAETHARTSGGNRNSLYSGHVASAAATSFFTAKIFCDFHPELGWKKYLVYGAATIPPLIEGYFRLKALRHFPSDIMIGFGVGALVGILVPECHRISIENISLGLYSSGEGTGIRLKWRPDFGI